MKLFGISLAAAALFALAPLASQAQHSHADGKADAHTAPGETHAHVAPHGGVVRWAAAARGGGGGGSFGFVSVAAAVSRVAIGCFYTGFCDAFAAAARRLR